MIPVSSNDRVLRVLTASPEQLVAIDRVLEGYLEPVRKGPLTMKICAAAELLGVHSATIRRMMDKGTLTPVPVLSADRVRRDEVEAIVFGKTNQRDAGPHL